MQVNGESNMDIDWEKLQKQNELEMELKKYWGSPKRWMLLREIYKLQEEDIMSRKGWVDPYFVDWLPLFTPIEMYTWQCVRAHSLPFYPQYPVHKYFLDFASPHLKIGLEADGKDWHDKEKDTKRDMGLAEHGWKIFRVTGSETVKPDIPDDYDHWQGDDKAKQKDTVKWIHNTVGGVVFAVNAVYGKLEKEDEEIMRACYQSLDNHRLADFAL